MPRFIERLRQRAAAESTPPDLHRFVWNWLRRKVGLRVATVVFIAVAVLLLFSSQIPSLYHRIASYFAPGASASAPAAFSEGELHIGVAVLADDGPSSQLVDEITKQFSGSKVVFVHPIPLPTSATPLSDSARTEAAVRQWLSASNADGALWAYSQKKAEGQLATRLWWTGRTSSQRAFSDSFDGLAAFLVNDWLDQSSIEFPTFEGLAELQSAALLLKDFAWRTHVQDRGQSEFELEIWSEEREQFAKIDERICSGRSSAQCKMLMTARLRWELLLPRASELNRGPFDFASALQLPSKWPGAPRNKAELLSYIQLVAGLLREAAAADDTVDKLDQLIAILTIQPWQLGKSLEEEIPEAPWVLDALKTNARLARLGVLANYEWEALDQSQREAAKLELDKALNDSTQLSSRMEQARALPRFVRGAIEMAMGHDLAVLDTMNRQYGVIEGLRAQASRASRRGYELLGGDSPNYRAFRTTSMEMFLLVYAPRVATLSTEDARHYLSLAETALSDLPPGASQAVRSDLITLSLVLQTKLRQAAGQKMPCEWIGRWSDAQRRLGDAGEWVWDSRFPRTLEFFFATYANVTPATEARQCLKTHGYDYDKLISEMTQGAVQAPSD